MTTPFEREDLEAARAHLYGQIRAIPDFPAPGILFRDITPLLADPRASASALALHRHHVAPLADRIDRVIGIESRGFLFGAPLAHALGVGFVPARKPGKLPASTIEESYSLEYGHNALQLHADALVAGSRVIIVDDLLATGGTAAATARLVERLGGEVLACVFLIELEGLGGRERLAGRRVEAILRYG
jgi:adenine phosphoribosyltransferase